MTDDGMSRSTDEIFRTMIAEKQKDDSKQFITRSRTVESSEFPFILCNPLNDGVVVTLPSPDFAREIYVKKCHALTGFDLTVESGGFEADGRKFFFVAPGRSVKLIAMPKHRAWFAF